VGTGALAGITRLTYGELYAVPEIEATALAAIREAIACAKALGIPLTSEEPRDAWLLAKEGLPPEFKTSMLQSLDKGLPTEIDFINGSVVRAGARCGVATPVNQALVACVKGIELWQQRPAAVSVPPRRPGAS
jgi:2-dehydropantoate 2-reductase